MFSKAVKYLSSMAGGKVQAMIPAMGSSQPSHRRQQWIYQIKTQNQVEEQEMADEIPGPRMAGKATCTPGKWRRALIAKICMGTCNQGQQRGTGVKACGVGEQGALQWGCWLEGARREEVMGNKMKSTEQEGMQEQKRSWRSWEIEFGQWVPC